MNVKSMFRLAVVGGLVLAGVSTSAHHSISAEYDEAKLIEIKGTVTRVEWVNPHAMFYVETEDKKDTWTWELGPPAMLMRRGWTRLRQPRRLSPLQATRQKRHRQTT